MIRGVPFRGPGGVSFSLDLDKSLPIAEVKIQAIAGCDLDPQLMKLIYKGKVLGDADTLDGSGVDGSLAVFIARGTAPPAARQIAEQEVVAGEAALVTLETSTIAAAGAAPGSSSLRVELKPPGGAPALEFLVDPLTTVQQLKVRAARETAIGMNPRAMRLMRKGRILKNEETLAALGISSGERLMVAKGMMGTADECSGAVGQTRVDQRTQSSARVGGDGHAAMPVPEGWQVPHGGLEGQLQFVQRALEAGGLGRQQAQMMQMQLMQNAFGLAGPPPEDVQMEGWGLEDWQRHVQEQQQQGQQQRQHQQQQQQLQQQQQRRMVAEMAQIAHGDRTLPERMEQLERDDPEMYARVTAEIEQARAMNAPLLPSLPRYLDRALERRAGELANRAALETEDGPLEPEVEEALKRAEEEASRAAGLAAQGTGRRLQPRSWEQQA